MPCRELVFKILLFKYVRLLTEAGDAFTDAFGEAAQSSLILEFERGLTQINAHEA
jgi:hypothetical protein